MRRAVFVVLLAAAAGGVGGGWARAATVPSAEPVGLLRFTGATTITAWKDAALNSKELGNMSGLSPKRAGSEMLLKREAPKVPEPVPEPAASFRRAELAIYKPSDGKIYSVFTFEDPVVVFHDIKDGEERLVLNFSDVNVDAHDPGTPAAKLGWYLKGASFGATVR